MLAPQLFVYYRVPAADVAAASVAVRELHAVWCAQHPAMACELLQRVDAAAGLVTLMEVYRCADGVTSAWQARIEADATAALAGRLVGERHVEVFAPCA